MRAQQAATRVEPRLKRSRCSPLPLSLSSLSLSLWCISEACNPSFLVPRDVCTEAESCSLSYPAHQAWINTQHPSSSVQVCTSCAVTMRCSLFTFSLDLIFVLCFSFCLCLFLFLGLGLGLGLVLGHGLGLECDLRDHSLGLSHLIVLILSCLLILSRSLPFAGLGLSSISGMVWSHRAATTVHVRHLAYQP